MMPKGGHWHQIGDGVVKEYGDELVIGTIVGKRAGARAKPAGYLVEWDNGTTKWMQAQHMRPKKHYDDWEATMGNLIWSLRDTWLEMEQRIS